MSSRLLVKNSIFYTIGNILPQAAGFILLPIYTAYLSPDQYGIVSSMTVLSTVIGAILTLGIERGIYRLYYDYNEEEQKVFLGTIIIGIVSFSAFLFIISLLIPNVISSIYKSIPFYPYYFLMLSFTLISKSFTVSSIYLRISEQANKFVVLNLLSFTLNASLILLFIIYFNQGAEGMLKGTLFTNLIMMPIFYFYSYKAIKFRFYLNYFRNSVKFSLPLLPAFISAWVLNLSDRVFIERYLSLHDLGIYSFGYRLASVATVLAGGIFTAYNPHFYKLAKDSNKEEKEKIGKYNNIIIFIIIIICFLIVFFAKETITLFVSEKYFSAINIIPILIIGIFFSQITGFVNLMIYQEKKSVQIMYITFAGAVVNVVSNLTLIPIFGIMGSAYATLISFLFLFVAQYIYAKKFYFIPFKWKIIIPFIGILILIYEAFILIETNSILLSLLLKIVVALAMTVFIYLKYSTQLKTVFNKK